MALTIDEKTAILDMRARQYSHRRIAHETGHSETTVRKVLAEAQERVINLKAKGLETNDIAIQLDYPLPFVSIAVDKANTMRAEAEEQGQTTQPPPSFDFKTEWEEFKRQQSLEIANEELQERAGELIDDLKNVESGLIKEKATSTDWRRRIGSLKKELTDFVLPQVTKADSKESLSALESIVEEIEHKVLSLYEEHQSRIKEIRSLRHRQEKELSDQLLDQQIDIPLFPQFLKKQVKDKFIVRNAEEALTVADALSQISLLVMKSSKNSPQQEKKMWHMFTDIVKEGGWSYVKRMAAQYREDTERLLVSINVCPNCDSKMGRKRVGDEVVVICPSCGKRYQILEQ